MWDDQQGASKSETVFYPTAEHRRAPARLHHLVGNVRDLLRRCHVVLSHRCLLPLGISRMVGQADHQVGTMVDHCAGARDGGYARLVEAIKGKGTTAIRVLGRIYEP